MLVARALFYELNFAPFIGNRQFVRGRESATVFVTKTTLVLG